MREKVKEESRKKREKIGRKVRWRERGGRRITTSVCVSARKREKEAGWC